METYKCEVCGKLITDGEGITTLSGLWVCDNDTCRTLDEENQATEKLSDDEYFEMLFKQSNNAGKGGEDG